jgi:hypothetical protein
MSRVRNPGIQRSVGVRLIATAATLVLALLLASSASADYQQVGHFAQSGEGEQLEYSSGAAVNVDGAGGVEPGSVYVSAPERVLRYGPKGEFKEAWGWNTIASGPDLPNQVNALKVTATSGAYRLEVSTAKGRVEEIAKGSNVITGLWTETGAFQVGDSISAPSNESVFPAGTTVVAVGAGTLELSASATRRGFGNSGVEVRALETTAPIPYDATAAELKAALVALPAFGAADVTVTGGPGDATGTTPYELTFEGAYAGNEVGISATESSLAGGNPSSSASVTTSVSPTGTPHYERCRVASGDHCTRPTGQGTNHGEGLGHFNGLRGIAIDQSTGYIYVLNGAEYVNNNREHNLIEVFSADGSESIARFGDAGQQSPAETIEAGPEKLHKYSGLAVDETGKAYVVDREIPFPYRTRLMCFKPQSPGDYHHYAYCGRPSDLSFPSGEATPEYIALDEAGHLYGARAEALWEYSLPELAAPLCGREVRDGGLKAMAPNPRTGEVFYFDYQDHKVHRLGPCDPGVGEFKEAQAPILAQPKTGEGVGGIRGLAVNPDLVWGPEREAGVLYGADADSHFVEGKGGSRGSGDIFAPAEVHFPSVEAESASAVRTASTVLGARINPHGYSTHYVFQYLTQAEYEANEAGERFAGALEAPAGGGEIGGGAEAQVAAAVSGLAPDTAYRFRVVVASRCEGEAKPLCEAFGEAASFATYPLYPPGLPDHRAYEMVSPPQKQGGEVFPASPRDGSCGAECKPQLLGEFSAMPVSAPEGGAITYGGTPFSPTEGAVNVDSYVSRRTQTGWKTTTLSPNLQAHAGRYVSFDTELNATLLYQERPTLSPEAPEGMPNLYAQSTSEPGTLTPLLRTAPPNRQPGFLHLAYAGHSRDLSRIFFTANDALTEATPFAPKPDDPGASKNDLYEWHEGELSLVNVLPGNEEVATGASFASLSPDEYAISANGSRAFFKDESGQLYVREGGEVTRKVNDAGHFLVATPDGSEALLSDGCLYDLQSESCAADLTEGEGGLQGIAGKSEDLSSIYFVDTAVLAANQGAGLDGKGDPQVAEAGKSNLYSWQEGSTAFVAQLATGGSFTDSADWAASPSERTAEASPHGRYLAFTSYAPLTGYDNVGPTCNRDGTGVYEPSAPCREAFLYDSQSGRLTCASCNPTGQTPLGPAALERIEYALKAFPQPRYLTDEGRLYFDSGDSLVARDTNEGVEDVYEFEMPGAGKEGTCEREAGCVFLISAGTEPVDSNLLAVDETAENVFFTTRDQLALKDHDDAIDLYDAREGGGIAAETEVSRAECQGEACQTPASAPNDPTPGSSTFEGAGNVKEEAKAKKHAKKHRKHAKKHRKAKKQARAAQRNHGGAK